MPRRWIEDITAVAGNLIFESLDIVRTRFLPAIQLQYGYSTFQGAVMFLCLFSIFYEDTLVSVKHISYLIFREDDFFFRLDADFVVF